MRRVISIGAVLLLVASVVSSSAAAQQRDGSLRSQALAGAVDLMCFSPLDVQRNPALRGERRWAVAVDWTRLYGMGDFELATGGGSYGNGSWSLSFVVQQLAGGDYFWERSYLAALSRRIAKELAVGVGLNYLDLQFGEGYRRLDATAVSAGIRYQVRSGRVVAFAWRNLNRPRYDNGLDPIGREADLSVTWQLSPLIAVCLNQRLIERLPDRFSAGQVFRLAPELSLQMGIVTAPTDFAGGISLKLAGIEFEYAYRNSLYLGGTHFVGVLYGR